MALRYLFYALAIAQVIFGLGFFFVPEQMGAAYSGAMTPTAVAVGRYWAATLLGLAYVSWMAGSAMASPLKLVIVRANAAISLISVIATFLAYSAGVISAAGTGLNVVLTGIFLIGFGYYGWVKKETMM